MTSDLNSIVDRVDAFYSSAFSNLLTLNLALLAFVGVVVPVLVQFYQSRVFARDKKAIEDFARLTITESLQNLRKEIAEDIAAKFAEHKKTWMLKLRK